MKKQKRVLKTIITLTMLIVLLTPMISFATNERETTIMIHTKTNTDLYNLGENVKVTVNWDSHKGSLGVPSDVQAIGFTLQYDENKLEFVDATFNEVAEDNSAIHERTLEEDFYNAETPGTVILSKISLNNLDISGINLNFKTTSIGETVIQLSDVDCVSDKNLVSPDVIDFTTNSLATIKTVALGDVDLNGTTDIGDATVLGQYLEGTKELTEQQLENADVNLDGTVDNVDLQLIQKSLDSIITLPIRYGDVDLNGKVNTKDHLFLARYLNGWEGYELNEEAMICADTNLDGVLNEIDCNVILFYAARYDFGIMPFKMIKNTNVKTKDIENLHIVSGFDLEKTKVSELLENFNTTKGYAVCNIADETLEDDAIFGTGAKVKIGGNGDALVEYQDGSKLYWVAEYNVVIYGDTTGDGKINAIDALALIKHLNDAIPFTNEIFTEAGRIVCEEGTEPTAVDALAIIKHANRKQLISQTK